MAWRTSVISRLFLSLLSVQTVLAGPVTFAREESHESPRNLDAVEWVHRRAIAKDYDAKSSDIGVQLWPKGTITYSYTDAAAKKALDGDLKKAWKVWEDALPKDSKFTFQELAADKDPEDEDYLLKISYDKPVAQGGSGTLKTTVAIPNNLKAGQFPTMVLSDDTTKGTKNVVANYAHEIGHALGFLHTHQNPNYWSTQFADGQGGAIFTRNNWHPENLADYETAIQYIDSKKAKETNADKKKKLEDKKTEMLTSFTVAYEGNFLSALDWLPRPKQDETRLEPDPTSKSKTDIDWESIMLYPSDAGAKAGRVVLTKPNGDKMAPNMKPSKKDIEALIALYKKEVEESDSD